MVSDDENLLEEQEEISDEYEQVYEDEGGRDMEVIMIAQLISEVNNEMDANQIERDIQDFSTHADVSDWKGIVRYFDAMAALTSLVSTNEDWSIRYRVVDYLISCFGTLKDAIAEHAMEIIIARTNGERVPKNNELLNGVSMFVVLVQRIIVQVQLYVSQISRDAISGTTGRKNKKNADLDDDANGWLNLQRNRLINCLLEILQLEVEVDGKAYKNCVEYIWKPDVMDPDFLKTFADTVCGLLDDPGLTRPTEILWIQKFFLIFKVLTLEFNKTDEVARRFLDKTMRLEYVIQGTNNNFPFIDALVTIGYNAEERKKTRNLRNLLETITIGACSLARCTLLTVKPLSLLIQSLGERVPDILLKHNYSVMQILEHDAYVMRSAGLNVLYDILKSEHMSKKVCEQFENRKKQRDTIYHKMMGHFSDDNAITRRVAVSVFTKLMECENGIPVEIQRGELVSKIGKRLLDKSVVVRKSAVQFLNTFLSNNAFGHDFDPNVLWDKQRKLQRDRRTMENPKNTVYQEAVNRFDSKDVVLKAAVRAAIDSHVIGNNNLEEVVSGVGDLNEQYETCVGTLLDKPALSCAILLHIYVTKEIYPPVNPNKSAEENRTDSAKWLYEKIQTDYVNNELRKHNMNDEELVVEEQRYIDYRAKQEELLGMIKMCKYKFGVEGRLRQCVQYSLRSVLMGELSEMKDSIKFLAKCKQFNIRGAENAVRSMCSLVWRNSLEVRKELLEAAGEMFISQYSSSVKETIREESTVDNLMNAMNDISESDRCSVEEVIYLLAQKNSFSKGVITRLWTTASGINRAIPKRIDALRIIYAITRSANGVVESRQRLRTLQQMMSLDSSLAYEALRVVSVLNTPSTSSNDVNAPVFRIPNDDSFFRSLEQLFSYEVLKDVDEENEKKIDEENEKNKDVASNEEEELKKKDDKNKWFSIVQITIKIILNIAKDVNELLPKFASVFLYRMRRVSEFYLFFKKQSSRQRRDYWGLLWIHVYERLVAFIGEVAVQMNSFIQLNTAQIHASYEARMKHAYANESTVPEETSRCLDEIELCITKRKSIFDYNTESSQQGESENFVNGFIQTFSERRVLQPKKLLGRLLPLVIYATRVRSMPDRIRDAGSFALGKFMTLSVFFSELAAPMFFTLMSKTPYPLVRANMLASCSDFAFAQPNLFELYAPGLYRMTRDVDAAARESAILVLSHLMSNDMIQVRGALFEPARCICDDAPAVAKIATSFFADLNRRGDALVNLLPEFIYRLACTGEKLTFSQYEHIFDYLIGLIRDKSRPHADNMIERICAKFGAMESASHPEAPKYLAFALSKFNLTDTGFFKLRDAIRHWSRFLNHRIVVNSLRDLLTVLIKSTKNEEVKREAEELQRRIERIQTEGLTTDVLSMPAPTPKRAARGRKPAARNTPAAKKRGRQPVFSDSDSD